MAIVPDTRPGKIAFYQSHLAAWAEDPASIGVTPEAVATLEGLVAEAREAYAEQQRAQQAAQAATQKFHDKVRRMHGGAGGGSQLLQTIKAFAAATDDPGVYVRAQITPPATPGRSGSLPAPGKPYLIAVKLCQTGAVELTWKCDNPEGAVGTLYHVRRRLDGETSFTYLGVSGAEKAFRDDTLPAGATGCIYEVTALRSTRRGPSAEHPVHFGGAPRLPSMQMRTDRLAA